MPEVKISNIEQSGPKVLFNLFCIWTFILLCRPQDIFPALGAIRPAMMTTIFTLIFVIIRSNELKGPPFFNESQVKYYTALLLIMILGIPFSLYPRLSFMTIFTEYIIVVIFFYVFYKVVYSIERLHVVLLVSCLGNGLYSIFAVGNYNYGRLSFGSMFDPNDLAFFALAFLPLNLLFITRDNLTWVRLASLTSFTSGVLLILLTGSRGGFIALSIVAAILLLNRTLNIRFSTKALFAFLFIALISFSSINFERFFTLLEIKNDYNIISETGRFEVWRIGINAMLANPITGVGVKNYPMAVGLDRKARGAETLRWQTAHNSLILIGTEIGVIGLILFLLMSFNIFRIFGKLKKNKCHEGLVKIGGMGYAGFAGLLIAGLFLSQAYSLYWAFYITFSSVANQLLLLEKKDKETLQKEP